MHSYTAFGYCIHSDIEIRGLAAGGAEPDIVISEIGREEWEQERQRGFALPAESAWLSAHFYRTLWYIVQGGNSIKVNLERDLPRKLVAKCVMGLPLAMALRQRGLLTLHACAVAKEGRAVAFVGPSGAGKSTLAEVFHQRGYQVLTDDLLAVRFVGEQPEALPGLSHIRLREGSGRRLLPEYDALPFMYAGGDQRLRLVEGSQQPVALERLYLIDAEGAVETRIEPVATEDAFQTLMKHTWAYNAFTAPADAARHLQHIGALIREGRVARFHRVRSLALARHVRGCYRS